MITVSLPQGHSAEFLDVDDVTGRLRKNFFKLVKDLDAVDTSSFAIAYFIRGWSLEQPVPNVESPTSLSMLEDLPVRTIDTMSKYVAALIKNITPNFEPDIDPASPTSPSGV